jgi:uncharacterized protein YjiS (DUF1127 family)
MFRDLILTDAAAPEGRGPRARAGAWVRNVVAVLGTWNQRRRTRAALAKLPSHLLRDIGLSAAEAAREAEKPFWRG